MTKKILSLLSFIFLLGVISLLTGVKANATDLITSDQLVVNGASVRTTGNAGIKFTASVGNYDTNNVTAYGIAIAYGSTDANNGFCVGGSINERTVLSATATELDNKDNFHVVLYGIPEAAYLKDLTARAFVIDNGETVYGTTVTVRNLAEVSLKALNDGETGDLLTSVVAYVSANYKKAYDSYDNGYTIDNAAFCYDPEELGQLFVSDWNKFVDESDRIESIISNTKANAASLSHRAKTGADFYYSAKWTKWSDTISTKNISESNLYQFFNDSFYGPKWGWLLTLIRVAESDAANSAWQAIAVQNDGTNSSKSLYAGQHLCLSIIGFFTKQKITYDYIGIDFESAKRNMYDNLYTGSYANTTVYNSFLRNHLISRIGENVTLPSERTPETGYSWVSYNLNSSDYAAESSYEVTSSNVHFKPKFELVNYTISYYDGSTPLNLSPSSYTILTDTFSLPNYEKDNYVFDGWYENELFEGDQVVEISRGSHVNKTLYAKTTYTPYATVNVTFNLNGGNWTVSDILSQNTPIKTIVATYYNSYQGNGYDISFVENTSQSTYWQYIVLEKTFTENVYRIIGKANGSANLPSSYDAVISYHSACTSEYKNDVSSIYSGSNVGQYITIENKPLSSGGDKSITIKLFANTVLNANHVQNMNEPGDLPTPVKDGYVFSGWLNSIDSQEYTSYPGYNSNPGNITYTAQWNAVPEIELSLNDARVLGLIDTPDIIVNQNPNYSSGVFGISGKSYAAGDNLFSSISDAVSALKGIGNTIYVFAGTYSTSFTLTAKGLSIVGPNEGLDARDLASRATEAVITGKITLSTTDKNITLSGFKFTEGGQVFTTSSASASDKIGIEGLTYTYNYVDKGENATPAILLDDGRKVHAKDILVDYCYFTAPNLSTVYTGVSGVIVTYDNRNITVQNSTFYQIPLNAIGLYNTSTGNGATGDVIIKGNVFENVTKSALWVAKHIPYNSTRTIQVSENKFINVAGGACVDFEAGDTSTYSKYVIEKNIFKDVVKCFWGNTNPGIVFKDNVVYKYASQEYVARCGSTTNPVDCERNLYLDTDGVNVITEPLGNGFIFHGASITTINENLNNYTSKDSYTLATGIIID